MIKQLYKEYEVEAAKEMRSEIVFIDGLKSDMFISALVIRSCHVIRLRDKLEWVCDL